MLLFYQKKGFLLFFFFGCPLLIILYLFILILYLLYYAYYLFDYLITYSIISKSKKRKGSEKSGKIETQNRNLWRSLTNGLQNCYYFDTRKGILHIPFLCRRLGRRRILPVIICSPHLSFLSILRLLILCLVSNQIEFRKQNSFCDISIWQ